MNLFRPIRRAAFVVVATTSACSDPTGPTPALSRLPRDLTASEQQVLRAGNEFSLALFRQPAKAQPGKNVFVSPLSASMALGMTMNGARERTLHAKRLPDGWNVPNAVAPRRSPST
jgi:serpin B